MQHPDPFDTTHAQLRELLVEASPADAAAQLLSRGHPPMHVLHALVTETRPAVVGALDALVRENVKGPLPEAYEAYEALQVAKAEAPSPTLDRDGYAVAAVERAGHGREAMGLALPWVVDVPDPSVDRRAVASLLLVSDPGAAGFDRSAPYAYIVTTPLVGLQVEARQTPVPEPPTLTKREHLEAQLGALDADRHQIRVRGPDGGTGYLAQGRDGAFAVVAEPTYLNNGQVLAALPKLEALNATANLDLVSESARHRYLVLDGLDAGQARDLSAGYGANLVMRVGDEHLAIVRLPEDPARAQAAAQHLRAQFPDRPGEDRNLDTPFPSREGSVTLVRARVEAVSDLGVREAKPERSTPPLSGRAPRPEATAATPRAPDVGGR